MKSNKFKQLIKHVSTCERNDDIWWCGWVFMNLTERQMSQLYTALLARTDFEETTFNGRCGIEIPSGLFLINPVTDGEWKR